MRENRTHGSEGGDGESRSRPLSNPGENVRREASPFSSSVGVRKIIYHFVVKKIPICLRLCRDVLQVCSIY